MGHLARDDPFPSDSRSYGPLFHHFLAFCISFRCSEQSCMFLASCRKRNPVTYYWTTPSTVKELQAFLGLSNYFRKFIQGYSAMVAIPKGNPKWGGFP